MVLARSLVGTRTLTGSTLHPLEGLDGAWHSKANSLYAFVSRNVNKM